MELYNFQTQYKGKEGQDCGWNSTGQYSQIIQVSVTHYIVAYFVVPEGIVLLCVCPVFSWIILFT
jgi:hypothetical protein